ncbi:LysR family transcriptional regulator [Krasilnikovia cinnamomea]|uniref:LysR family transcriptional regulator n=1 Tax=Krasilnikovia cinnamomea TaxID=349313 RepID=UPI001F5EE153|nr:LysR family transcriptional regulator [Krasilnikovia cinnamomea]
MKKADHRWAGQAGINWGDVIAFRVLAEELSFTRAAVRLDITQPALSVRIRRLEQSFGNRLLDRHTRLVRLTVKGRLLRDWVDQAARGWKQIQDWEPARECGEASLSGDRPSLDGRTSSPTAVHAAPLNQVAIGPV